MTALHQVSAIDARMDFWTPGLMLVYPRVSAHDRQQLLDFFTSLRHMPGVVLPDSFTITFDGDMRDQGWVQAPASRRDAFSQTGISMPVPTAGDPS